MDTKKLTSKFWRQGVPTAKTDDLPHPTGNLPEATTPSGEATASPSSAGQVPASGDAHAIAAIAATPDAKVPPAPPPISRLVEGKPQAASRIDLATYRLKVQALASAAKPASLPMAAAAAIVLALGLGYQIGVSNGAPVEPATRFAAAAADIRQNGQEIARLAAELKAMKGTVEAVRGDRDKSRGEILARQAQLSERVERAHQDHGAKLGKLAEQIDRIEKSQRDPARLALVTERLDRLERTLAGSGPAPSSPPPAPTPPPKPVAVNAAAPEVTQTGSIAEAKVAAKPETDPRKSQIDGFFVRDVDDGFALIETKAGRYMEVTVGNTVPAIGRVEAIERRGRQWVVVTTKGFIAER